VGEKQKESKETKETKEVEETKETKEAIRVLIADDIVQTRTDIRRLLYFEEDVEVVGEAGTGREALDLIGETRPDIILMDINMPVMDGITATEEVSFNHPEVSVIIISIQGEQEYLKKAMAAGARDYLVKPLSSEEMANTIRQVYRLNRRRNQGISSPSSPSSQVVEQGPALPDNQYKTVTLFSGKGGTGKTTLAANLAVVLARKKMKVALVDLDLQFGDISLLFNVNDTRNICDLAEEEEINRESLDSCLIHHISGVYILAASPWPQEAEKLSVEQVKATLKTLQESFDCVIIDTAATFNEINLMVLEESDLIMLPARKDIAAIKNIKAVLDILQSLNLENKVQVVLNQANLDLGIELKELEQALERTMAHSITGDEKAVVTSINKGVPFVTEYASAEITKNMVELGDKMLHGFKEKSPDMVKKHALAKLFSF